MLRVRLVLDRLHCHLQTDKNALSEPYLWTVFFKGDIESAMLGPKHRIATFTHHDETSAREFFPGGVDTGDDVSIPIAMGVHSFLIDRGGLSVAAVGFLAVLLEKDESPEHAMRAGHQAFAEAADLEINAYVDDHFPAIVKPSDEEIKEIAGRIAKEAKDAVRDELAWYQIFSRTRTTYSVTGTPCFCWKISSKLPRQSRPSSHCPRIRIQHEKKLFNPTTGETLTLVNDYELFGRIRVERADPQPTACTDELAAYDLAVARPSRISTKPSRL